MIESWSDERDAFGSYSASCPAGLKRRVVVDDVGLVGVDVPLGGAR